MHQFLAKLPFANFVFRTLLKVDFIVRSPILLNQFYSDKSLLKESENLEKKIIPLQHSKEKNSFSKSDPYWKIKLDYQHKPIRNI